MKLRTITIGLALTLCALNVSAEDLRADTATQVAIGPFIDGTDGVTAETALTVTEWDCDLIKHANSSMATTSLTITASSGSNDAAHIESGMYSLELTASNLDTEGEATLICDHATPATFIPVRHKFNVLGAAEYDIKYGAGLSTAAGGCGAYPSRGILASGTMQSYTDSTFTLVLPAACDFADDVLNGATVLLYGATSDNWESTTISDYTSTGDSAVLDAALENDIEGETITGIVFGSAEGSTPPTAAAIVNEWETQSQADPTGFHVNVLEVGGTSQTANDNGADINNILTDTGTTIPGTITTAQADLDTITGTNGVLVDDDAITAAKIAANAIGASEVADDAVDAGAIADASIDAATFAANAVTDAAVANDVQVDVVTVETGDATDALVTGGTAALAAEVVSEPAGLPAWDTATLTEAVAYLMAWYRNEVQQTSSVKTLRNDADDAAIVTCGVSDNGTVAQVDECAAP